MTWGGAMPKIFVLTPAVLLSALHFRNTCGAAIFYDVCRLETGLQRSRNVLIADIFFLPSAHEKDDDENRCTTER